MATLQNNSQTAGYVDALQRAKLVSFVCIIICHHRFYFTVVACFWVHFFISLFIYIVLCKIKVIWVYIFATHELLLVITYIIWFYGIATIKIVFSTYFACVKLLVNCPSDLLTIKCVCCRLQQKSAVLRGLLRKDQNPVLRNQLQIRINNNSQWGEVINYDFLTITNSCRVEVYYNHKFKYVCLNDNFWGVTKEYEVEL